MTDTATFAEAYATLNESVEALRRLSTDNIDQLVGLVETAAQAHGQCKQRIKQVEQLLAVHLTPENPGDPTLEALFGEL